MTCRDHSMRGARLVAGALAIALAGAACADKDLLPPRALAGMHPTIALQVTGAQVGSVPVDIIVGVIYDNGHDGEPVGIARTRATGASQSVSLPLDLTACLNDAGRGGSKDACTVRVGAAVVDTGFSLDTSEVFGASYDAQWLGQYDLAPGKPLPTLAPVDLSLSRHAARRWVGDAALTLGGAATPLRFTGPTAGTVDASGNVTIFGVTQGPADFIPGQPSPFTPQLAAFSGGTWKRVTATGVPSNSAFSDVSALAANDVYMAHPNGLYHFDGTSISRVSQINDSVFSVGTVNTAGGKFIVAGTQGGSAWIGNGTTWTRYSVPNTTRLDGACITGANEAFLSSNASGGLFRFNGTSWSSVPAANSGAKVDLQCTGPGQAFVAVSNGPLLQWNGSGWQNFPTVGLSAGRFVNWAVVSPTEAYAVGDSASTNRAFYRFNGTSWSEVGRTRFAQMTAPIFRRPWADPRGGAMYYLSGFGRLERATPGGVSVLSYRPGPRDAWVNSSTSAFVVGWNLFLARWDGAKWNVDAPPQTGPFAVRVLHGVWSDGPNNAWAVGNVSTILRWNGSSWASVSHGGAPIATADNYNSVWGSGSHVWVAGDGTMLHCTNTSCVNESTGGTGILYSVWGTSASDVWAVGAGGRIVHWNGTAWSPVGSPTTRTLARVRGSAANDVWAVGDTVLLHFDGTIWKNIPMDEDLENVASKSPSPFLQAVFQIGLWVRTTADAYLGGDVGHIARKVDDLRWSTMDFVPFRRRVIAISGDATGCVLALTEAETESPTPTLWRGQGQSGCFAAAMAPPTSWP